MDRQNLVIIIIVTVVSMLLLGGGIMLLGGGVENVEEYVYDDEAYFLGKDDASVTMTYFSNFACHACAGFVSTTDSLHEKYGDQLKIVYRHLPTTSASSGVLAAEAAEAAGAQDKFWEMHDILFSRQAEWISLSGDNLEEQLITYAEEATVPDLDRFTEELHDRKYSDRVGADIKDAGQINVERTPTVFLGDERVKGPTANAVPTLESIEEKIDELLGE